MFLCDQLNYFYSTFMKTVSGKYFGQINFSGRIIKTTIVNGKIIHDIILHDPITNFGDIRYQILVPDIDLMLGDSLGGYSE